MADRTQSRRRADGRREPADDPRSQGRAPKRKVLQDSDVEGILKAEEIQELIDSDHIAFASRALALHDAAEAALKAIDAKNVAQLSEVGGVIDEACEQCHTKYWYPNQPVPGEPPASEHFFQPGLRATAQFAAAAADSAAAARPSNSTRLLASSLK